MRRFFIAFFLFTTAFSAEARDRIWIVGSGTVYPFVTSAAEHFGKRSQFRTPVVEATGTGGGFKLFCEGGAKLNSPDMSDASRTIKESEIALCNKNGVHQIIPLKIGLDGIILANSVRAPHQQFTRQQIFLALAKMVPVNGKLAPNPYKKWNDIDKSLPAIPIEVYGPPITAGTRDAFVELVMQPPCMEMAEFAAAYPDKKKRELACGVMREDGPFLQASEDYNLLIQKLSADPKSFGIFGYNFLEENADKVQAVDIDNVKPTFDNVSRGIYPVTRPLYVYIKGEHLGQIQGMQAFMQELSREGTIGDEGYLAQKGLIPLPFAEREAMRKLANINPLISTAPAHNPLSD